jgi:hypothetical protein
MESEDSMSTRLFLFIPILSLLACGEPSCPEDTMPRGGACVPIEIDASSIDAGETSEMDAGEIDETDSAVPDGGQIPEPDGCSPRDFFRDADEDGHGDPEAARSACVMPEGYVESSDDCDDACPSCHPGGTEVCDELDQDCDDAIDEDLTEITSYADADGDTYGDGTTAMTGCSLPEGRAMRDGDCDDGSSAVHPGVTEICNGVNDDCDEGTDEGLLSTYFRDADSDGFGVASMMMQACAQPSGYVTNDDDCDDDCRMCFPGGNEVCDDLNNDCDGNTDEGVKTTFYADCDGDGYAPMGADSYQGCSVSTTRPAGCSLAGTWTPRNPTVGNRDCLDTNPSVYPNNLAYYSSPASGLTRAYDYNCDGVETMERTEVGGRCQSGGGPGACFRTTGWTTDEPPACGVTGDYVTGCTTVCFPQFSRGRQACR